MQSGRKGTVVTLQRQVCGVCAACKSTAAPSRKKLRSPNLVKGGSEHLRERGLLRVSFLFQDLGECGYWPELES